MEPSDIVGFTQVFHARFEADDPDAASKLFERTLVGIVRHQFDALGQGDVSTFLDLMHPDVELEIAAPPEFDWIRRARGVAELRAAVEHNFAILQDQEPELVSVIAQGHVVVVVGRERRRIRESGERYDVCFVYQFTFRDGKVWRILEVAARA